MQKLSLWGRGTQSLRKRTAFFETLSPIFISISNIINYYEIIRKQGNGLSMAILFPTSSAFFLRFFFLDFFGDSMDVWQRYVDFGMLQLVVLVQTAFRSIGLGTVLSRTLIESLNLMGGASNSLILFLVALIAAKPFLFLLQKDGTSYLLRRMESLLRSSTRSLTWEVRAILAR